MNLFLSHNTNDKELARSLGAQLKLAGADVWFDEWEIAAGESIPTKVNAALATADAVLVVWSGNAAGSKWVANELEAAYTRSLSDPLFRLIPILIDETPLPPLVASLKHLRLANAWEIDQVVAEVMGFKSARQALRAIQQTLEETGLRVEYVPGYGAIVACPACGAGIESLEGWSQTDYVRDDVYGGFRCKECGHQDGGEIW